MVGFDSLKRFKEDIDSVEREIDNSFSEDKKPMTGGIEIEVYLMRGNDPKNLRLCDNQDVMNNILLELPKEITRDYYTYQLEVRSKPHSDPESMIKELETNFLKATEVAAQYGHSIVPLSSLGTGDMFNGMHFHIRYEGKNNFYNTMINSYPFVLSLANAMKNSPECYNDTGTIYSHRMINSPHIRLPRFKKKDFNNGGLGSNRYNDVVINKSADGDRHRNKTISTLEFRMFDVPSDWDYMKNFVRMMYSIFQHLKTKELNLFGCPDLIHYEIKAKHARNEIVNNLNPSNIFFGNSKIPSFLVMERLIDRFGLDFPLIDPYPSVKNIKSSKNFWNVGMPLIQDSYSFMSGKRIYYGDKKAKRMTPEEVLDTLGPICRESQEVKKRREQSSSSGMKSDFIRRMGTLPEGITRLPRLTNPNAEPTFELFRIEQNEPVALSRTDYVRYLPLRYRVNKETIVEDEDSADLIRLTFPLNGYILMDVMDLQRMISDFDIINHHSTEARYILNGRSTSCAKLTSFEVVSETRERITDLINIMGRYEKSYQIYIAHEGFITRPNNQNNELISRRVELGVDMGNVRRALRAIDDSSSSSDLIDEPEEYSFEIDEGIEGGIER